MASEPGAPPLQIKNNLAYRFPAAAFKFPARPPTTPWHDRPRRCHVAPRARRRSRAALGGPRRRPRRRPPGPTARPRRRRARLPALALQGLVTLNHGDLQAALALAGQAERHAAESAPARCELASLKALLAFFSGSYTEALQQADAAVAIADATDDLTLQVFARRMACPVFGNLGVPDLGERFADALELSILDGDRWQEALSRNDVACWHHEEGRVAEAEAELARGLELAAPLEPNRFLVGVLHATRADIRLLAGRPTEALADAEQALAALIEHGEPNPYIFGVTVRAQVQALAALDRVDDARHAGERALERLGDQVPHTRSLVLGAIAAALREAGHVEDAYDALSRSAELEREGLRQLAELRVDLERTMLEAAALADQNAQLEALVRELNAAHASSKASRSSSASRPTATG